MPSTASISLPNSVYESACNGNVKDVHVVLHEIGHAILGHEALLHYSETPATQLEDACWQADSFADVILNRLGIAKEGQFELTRI